MKKLSELLGRPAENGVRPVDAATMVDYRIRGEGFDRLETIDRFYKEIDFPRSMRNGNLGHLSGVSDDEIVFMSIWDTEKNAMAAFDDMRGSIEKVLREAGPTATVDRVSSGVFRFSIGEDVAEFSHERAQLNPNCVGYVIDIPTQGHLSYELTCEKMNFPQDWPPGLLMHVAGETDRGWRTYSLWREIGQSRDFLAQRLIPAAVDVVREHQVFPVIRPIEVKLHLFALNSRMLD
jgi:hypothetical protein